MARFQPKRFEQLLAQGLARVVARAGITDVGDTSIVKHLVAACARMVDEAYYQMTRLRDLFSLDRASGEDLDERVKDYIPSGIKRKAATKAAGSVVFSRTGTTGTVNVPVGTRVRTASSVLFQTTEQAQILNGQTTAVAVAAVAVAAGVAGNVGSGTVVYFESKPAGVDFVTNPSPFTAGTDRETDDALRARVRLYVRGLARSTVAALEGAAQNVVLDSGQSCVFAKAVENQVNLGNVILYIDDGSGTAEAVATIATPAAAVDTATIAQPYNITNGQTLNVEVNGDPQVVTFQGADFAIPGAGTAAEVATRITADLTGATGGVATGNKAKITTDKIGDLATLKVTGGTANGVLGFPTTEVAGIGDTLTAGLDPDDEAVGGEEYLYFSSPPVKDTNPIPVTSSTRGALTRDVHYTLNPASGQLKMTPALAAGELVAAGYTHYTGLIQEVQKVVDGDPLDRLNYPGVRAAGVLVRVLPPTVRLINIEGVLTILEGYDRETVADVANDAVAAYLNSLGISNDVLLAEIIARVMAISGVRNFSLVDPAADVVFLDSELCRAGTMQVQ